MAPKSAPPLLDRAIDAHIDKERGVIVIEGKDFDLRILQSIAAETSRSY